MILRGLYQDILQGLYQDRGEEGGVVYPPNSDEPDVELQSAMRKYDGMQIRITIEVIESYKKRLK